MNELKIRLRDILNQFVPCLRDLDIANIDSCIGAGELELALETLCEQIYEYDCGCSEQQLAVIKQLAHQMGMPPTVWRLIDPKRSK